MSGISRNTLRLIGTAKYLRTMKLTTNGLNNSLALLKPQYCNYGSTQAESTSGVFTVEHFADHSHIVSSLLPSKLPLSIKKKGKVTKAKTGLFKASLSSGSVKLIGVEDIRRVILHPTFNMQLNGESIEPESDKTADPDDKGRLNLDRKWHVSRDGDKLIFRVKNREETFILKHTVNIIAHEKPRIRGENGDCNVTSGKIISDVSVIDAKLLSNQSVFVQSFPFIDGTLIPPVFSEDEITDRPNRKGEMKLNFPMTASLEGARKIIKMEDSDDYCTVNHRIDFEAYKTLPENGNNELNAEVLEEKGNILRMELESGDVIIEPIAHEDRYVIIQQDACIEINLDSAVPYIRFLPYIKNRRI